MKSKIVIKRPLKDWIRTNLTNWDNFKFTYTPRTIAILHDCKIEDINIKNYADCVEQNIQVSYREWE